MRNRTLTVPASVLALLAAGRPLGVLVRMDTTDQNIERLIARRVELHTQSTEIIDACDGEKRDPTVEENRMIDDLTAEFDRVGAEIERRQRIVNQQAALTDIRPRQTDPDAIVGDNDGDPVVPPTRIQQVTRPRAVETGGRPEHPSQGRRTVEPVPRSGTGNGGFRSFGDFAQCVKAANPRFGGSLDNRLARMAAASTYANEGVGADGGFAVPPDFRDSIISKVFSEANLISRTDKQSTSSNSVTMPVDNTTPWQASGGVQAYWVGEAQTKTQSKIQLEQQTIKAHQLATLVPVTEELLEDAPALDGYLRRKVPEKIDFKVSMALAWGDGAGQPLGFMNSPALVTQAAEAAQAVDTVVAGNVTRMLSRLPVSSRATAVWLIHPDLEPLLPLMVIGTQPVYLGPGGLSQSTYGTLLGRPVIPHQVCNAIGDLGDLMLVDFNQYLTLLKTGGGRDANGLKTDVSIHLWFDQDLVAYRFTLRVGGMPWWNAPTAMRTGNTQSPFVVLAAR